MSGFEFTIRAGTPRLREFIQRRVEEVANGKKGPAAQKFGWTPSELANFTNGVRVPSPQKILNMVSAGVDRFGSNADFAGEIDQQLIEAGYAPCFFRNMVSPNQPVLLLTSVGDLFYEAKDFTPSGDLLALYDDVRFTGRTTTLRLALVERGDAPCLHLLIEPTLDDTYLANDDVVLCSHNERLCFARFIRSDERTYLCSGDLFLDAYHGDQFELPSERTDIKARVVLRFQPLQRATGELRSRKPPLRLDLLHIGIAPFQDALLPIIGQKLGLFESEGLLLRPERIGWYDWTNFFLKGPVDVPRLTFANLFSFVKDYHLMPDLRYLYGVNIFDNGFCILARDKHTKDKWIRLLSADDVEIELWTILKSDWAAQVYTYCKAAKINLAFAWGRGIELIYPAERKLPGRSTIIIRDTLESGVESDPSAIHAHATSYLGSLPQRLRLQNKFEWQTVDLSFSNPYPVNGFVGRADMVTKHHDVLMRFLRVWFRIVNYIRLELDDLPSFWTRDSPLFGSHIVREAFEQEDFPQGIAKPEILPKHSPPHNEVVLAWKNESFPHTPTEIENAILSGGARSAWREDAGRAIEYLELLSPKEYSRNEQNHMKNMADCLNFDAVLSEKKPFVLDEIHANYISRFGKGSSLLPPKDDFRRPIVESTSIVRMK